jgi:polysaccharide export outer membrane protein
MRAFAISLLTSACLLAGCAQQEKFIGRPGLTVVEQTALPPPAREDLILEKREYLIGPYDRLAVNVYGVPELSREVQVDAGGSMGMPLIGTIQASGKTPGELSNEVAGRLRGRYVRDPQVTVNLTETVSQQITVDGAVQEPGVYPVNGRMTLMRAVARAKGLSEFANARYVVVFRKVNKRDMAALYDLAAIRAGMYEDPDIYANDIVQVGDNPARRIFRDVVATAPLLAAPLVALLN